MMQFNERKVMEDFKKYLQNRGRQATVEGDTVEPPQRRYKTIPEEMIELLHNSPKALTIKEISNYLGFNPKSVSKSMTKMMQTDIGPKYIIKTKKGKSCRYSANISGTDVEGLYSVIRNDFSSKVRKIPPSLIVVRRPFEGVLLHEQPVLMSIIMTPEGSVNQVFTPLPIDLKVETPFLTP